MPTRQEALLLIRYQTSLRDSAARYSARQSLNAELAMSARFSGLEAGHDWESGFAFRHCGGPGRSAGCRPPASDRQRGGGGRLAGAVKPPVSSKNAHSPSSSTSIRQPSSELPAMEFINHACAASALAKFFVATISPCGPTTRNLAMRCE